MARRSVGFRALSINLLTNDRYPPLTRLMNLRLDSLYSANRSMPIRFLVLSINMLSNAFRTRSFESDMDSISLRQYNSKCIKVTFTIIQMDKVTVSTHKFKIEGRRRRVASFVARAMTESEIAQQLNVNQSTISRDVKILRQLSQKFIYDLAKSDLAYYYKQCINGIEEANKEAWRIYLDDEVPLKEKLAALKIIIQANESKFKLLTEGPSILAMKSLEERLNTLESSSPLSTK
jgi:hypothetical protein